MLHSLATAQVSLDDRDRLALPSGEVLRGPARPDLIRDELLCEIFAATAASRPSAIAMITVEGNLTYAEADAKAEEFKLKLYGAFEPQLLVGLALKEWSAADDADTGPRTPADHGNR